jgi:isoleucyl-tRNA synthetase
MKGPSLKPAEPTQLEISEIKSGSKLNTHSVTAESSYTVHNHGAAVISSVPPLSERIVRQDNPQQQRVAQSKNYTGFITRQELEARVNRNQDDYNIDFPATRNVSSAFKTVLSGLENYHRSVKPFCPRTKEDALLHLSMMKKQLDILSQSLFSYNSGWPHGNKISMQHLQSLVEEEEAKLNTLTVQLKNGDKLPQEMTITEALALTQQRVLVKDFQLACSAAETNADGTEKSTKKTQKNTQQDQQVKAQGERDESVARNKLGPKEMRDFV